MLISMTMSIASLRFLTLFFVSVCAFSLSWVPQLLAPPKNMKHNLYLD